MFLVPPIPSRNFLEYDRILRQVMMSDAMDRIAKGEAETRLLGGPRYRGPTENFIAAYERANPLHPVETVTAH